MKKAIISGATGLIGSAVANYFISQKIDLLCLGRRVLNPAEVYELFGAQVNYLSLDFNLIELLPDHISSLGWTIGEDCAFFHFAWAGHTNLTDGGLSSQLANAVRTAKAVQVAQHLGCSKFINSGSLEETLAERWLETSDKILHSLTQIDYVTAKLAARDLAKINAYLHKIDYIHTRLSAPLDFTLSRGSYIANTLKDIALGKDWQKPGNTRLFDIISTEDVARAYFSIGNSSAHKADYFIGTSRPAALLDYFQYFEAILNGLDFELPSLKNNLELSLFDTTPLKIATGFVPLQNFHDLLTHSQQK